MPGMKITSLPEGPACLNIGCGNFFFREWTNIDLAPAKGVDAFDIRRPLPYPAGTFDAVYSSHVLEHLTPADGKSLLQEKWRVLKPGGICRVVVPDLETICREYLKTLDVAAASPTPANRQHYRWMVLELLDQIVREKSGGLMRETLERGDFDEGFVRARMGDQFEKYYRQPGGTKEGAGAKRKGPKLGHQIKRALKSLTGKSDDPRVSGEAHRWMYDRVSLRWLFEETGFRDFAVQSFTVSGIPYWAKYNLDQSKNGAYARKPDSLYVEGRKPA
jgi:predicted SAM-dependent methyltransferase